MFRSTSVLQFSRRWLWSSHSSCKFRRLFCFVIFYILHIRRYNVSHFMFIPVFVILLFSITVFNLRFNRIKDVRTNCFSASLLRTKFTRHVMYRARALSSKVNNDRENSHRQWEGSTGRNDTNHLRRTALFRSG